MEGGGDGEGNLHSEEHKQNCVTRIQLTEEVSLEFALVVPGLMTLEGEAAS